MRRLLHSFSAIWQLAFVIVFILTIITVVIHGFDLKTSKGGRKHILLSLVSNSGSSHSFYPANEAYGFTLDTYYDGEVFVQSFSTYDKNDFPHCYTCGYYDDTYGLELSDPHKIGNVVYTINQTEYDDGFVPIGHYGTYNLETKTVGSVADLSEIHPNAENAADEKYKVDPGYVTDNFEEVSYAGLGAWDCESAYSNLYILYGILLFWGLLEILIRRVRKSAQAQ